MVTIKSTPEFTIFKKGVTNDGPVTIVSVEGVAFNKAEKIKHYQDLGYKVKSLNKK